MKVTILLACVAGLLTSAQGDINYGLALKTSMFFYEAQRSGDNEKMYNRVSWRSASAMDDEITEGYYDAGDHLKITQPMAFTMTMLAWSGIKYSDAYDSINQEGALWRTIAWGCNYLVDGHLQEDGKEMIVQIGDINLDHAKFTRAENMTMSRPSFWANEDYPCAEVVADSAAALAACSMYASQSGRSGLAAKYLSHAEDLFAFADENRVSLMEGPIALEDLAYPSWDGFGDELAWAALWLYKATDDTSYLTKAETFYSEYGLTYSALYGFGWGGKLLGVHSLLYEATGDAVYKNLVETEVSYYLNTATYSPGGLLVIREWGSIAECGNVVFIINHNGEMGISTTEVDNLVTSQVDYILGDNPNDLSYMVGFTDNYPLYPHHAGASCPVDVSVKCNWKAYNSEDPNPTVLKGAVVGGPDAEDSHNDARSDYIQNEVSLNYNAGVQGLIAAVINKSL